MPVIKASFFILIQLGVKTVVQLAENKTKNIKQALLPLSPRPIFYSPLYSAFVSLLKVVLPTLAFSISIIIILWSYIQDNVDGFSIGLTANDLLGRQSLAVTNAFYQGKEKSGNPFNVTASRINQQGTESNMVNLELPKADIILPNESWAALTSEKGLFDKNRQVLELFGDVNFFHDMGYEFRTESAILDFIGGHMFGFQFLEGQGPFGYIQAEGFRVFDRGARIELTGKAKVIFNKPNKD